MAFLRQIANWCFWWEDAIVEMGATIEASSAVSASFPIDNLLDAEPSTVAQFSGTGTLYVTFDLDDGAHIAGFGLFNHNMNTKTVTAVTLYGSDAPTSGFVSFGAYTVASVVGDDDFVAYVNPAVSHRYWKVEFTGADAGLYIGRIYLAQHFYQLANVGPAAGAVKGYAKPMDTDETLGGVERRLGRGNRRRIISASVPADPGTDLVQIKAMIDQCEVGEKCFCMTDAEGTTVAATNANCYGAGIHARINADSWRYILRTVNVNDVPLEIIEVR
jgi:hypothetical protein